MVPRVRYALPGTDGPRRALWQLTGDRCLICVAKFSAFHMKKCECKKCNSVVCRKCSVEIGKDGSGVQVGPAGRFLSRSRALALSLPHPLPSLFAAHPDREACVALRPKTSVAGTRSIDRWSITRLAALILDGSERI
eukprot:1290054-Rhodomonas_salina.2